MGIADANNAGNVHGGLIMRLCDRLHVLVAYGRSAFDLPGAARTLPGPLDLFGFPRRYYLSTRPEKAIGEPALWEQAERALEIDPYLDAAHELVMLARMAPGGVIKPHEPLVFVVDLLSVD